MNSASIVSKVWSFCTTLRDDGVGYGDHLEQLTYLIFLKMADEYARPPYRRDVGIPVRSTQPFHWGLRGGRTRPTASGRSVSAPWVRRSSSQASSNPAAIHGA